MFIHTVLPAVDVTTLMLNIFEMTKPILKPFESVKAKTLRISKCIISLDTAEIHYSDTLRNLNFSRTMAGITKGFGSP